MTQRNMFLVLVAVLAIATLASPTFAGNSLSKGAGSIKIDNDSSCSDPDREENVIDNDDTSVTVWLNVQPENYKPTYTLCCYDKGNNSIGCVDLSFSNCGGDFDNWWFALVDFDSEFSSTVGSVTCRATDTNGDTTGSDSLRLTQ